MLKKAFLFFLITLLSSSLNSCFMPPELMFEQVIEYKPEKAGAEITKKIPFGHYDYVNYQNNQLYTLCNGASTDTVTFYDFTNDGVITKKTVKIFKKSFAEHYIYKNTQCLNIINDEIILLANITDNSTDKSFYSLLHLNENDSALTFYDHSSDFEDKDSIYQFYYDNDNHIAYSTTQKYYRKNQDIKQYNYDESKEKFLQLGVKKFNEYGYVFLTQNYFMLNLHDYYPDVTNLFYIYRNYADSSLKRVNLTFLGMDDKLCGAFADDDSNIWLYVSKYDSKTERYNSNLLKLKLLTTEAAENEYRRTSCR